MKKRVLKVVTAWALVLCMTIPTMLSVQAQEGDDVVSDAIDQGTFVVQHHTLIDGYRDGEFGAPDAPEGYSDYLFAGWYADEIVRQPRILAIRMERLMQNMCTKMCWV